MATELLGPDALVKLTLGLSGAQDQNCLGVAHAGNDLVVEFFELDHDLSLPLVFGHEIIPCVRVLGAQTRRQPRRTVVLSDDLQHVFVVIRQQHHHGPVMVDPYACVHGHRSPRLSAKKTDVAQNPKVFSHVGLLFNKPLGKNQVAL
jgi:hypothetical protein